MNQKEIWSNDRLIKGLICNDIRYHHLQHQYDYQIPSEKCLMSETIIWLLGIWEEGLRTEYEDYYSDLLAGVKYDQIRDPSIEYDKISTRIFRKMSVKAGSLRAKKIQRRAAKATNLNAKK